MNTDNPYTQLQQAVMEELEVFLDARQAELLQMLERLGELRAAVIKRDEPTLTRLLEQVQQDAEERRRLDTAQRHIERQLAEAFGGLGGCVTLSALCACLDERHCAVVQQKQQQMLELVHRVRHEAEMTELMLRECARCNRLLLSAILGPNQQSVTYGPQGQGQWDVHRGLVSMKL
jgi:flagellar biosynthesis/type III secretory pathway chaperone